MKPVLSVVMSTYNRLQMLPDALVSVLSQSFGDFEFIIIDDNSTDGTFDYLHSLRDDRIKLFKNHENTGDDVGNEAFRTKADDQSNYAGAGKQGLDIHAQDRQCPHQTHQAQDVAQGAVDQSKRRAALAAFGRPAAE